MENNVTALATAAASLPVASTGGTELTLQLFLLVATIVIGLIGYFAMKWLRTSEYAKKYNLDNERTERILTNAIAWVDGIVKTEGNAYLIKHKLSIAYFNKVAPDLVKKYGDAINDMVTRKMVQLQTSAGAVTPVVPGISTDSAVANNIAPTVTVDQTAAPTTTVVSTDAQVANTETPATPPTAQ